MSTPDYSQYPAPAIPLAPVLSGYSLFRKKAQEPASILDLPYKLHVTSGRAAIALALEHAGIGKDDEVLIPALHCESMISPSLWREATPVFFRVHPDTRIDLADITHKITPRTKAIIVTHYFGFLQTLTELRQLCDQHNLVMIEDCAHAFFGETEGQSVGSSGDYAIASSMKFFPCYDGGVLASKHSLAGIQLHNPAHAFQLKSFFNIVERGSHYQRFGIAGKLLKALITLKESLWKQLKKRMGHAQNQGSAPASSDGGYGLDVHWIHKHISWASGFVIRNSNKSRIAQARRANYRHIEAALSSLSTARPLHPSLPDGCVPLVFPLVVDNPKAAFDTLKRQGVPIWRFGEYLDPQITDELCPASTQLSAHVFQFPCHQELKQEELDWMLSKIKAVIK